MKNTWCWEELVEGRLGKSGVGRGRRDSNLSIGVEISIDKLFELISGSRSVV